MKNRWYIMVFGKGKGIYLSKSDSFFSSFEEGDIPEEAFFDNAVQANHIIYEKLKKYLDQCALCKFIN